MWYDSLNAVYFCLKTSHVFVVLGHSKRLQDDGSTGQSHRKECALLTPGWQREEVPLRPFCFVVFVIFFYFSQFINTHIFLFPVTSLMQCFQSPTLLGKRLSCKVRLHLFRIAYRTCTTLSVQLWCWLSLCLFRWWRWQFLCNWPRGDGCEYLILIEKRMFNY